MRSSRSRRTRSRAGSATGSTRLARPLASCPECSGISDKNVRTGLSAILAEEKFEGKSGQAMIWYSNGNGSARRYIVVGLGKKDRFGPGPMRDAVATAARKGESVRAKRLTVQIPG